MREACSTRNIDALHREINDGGYNNAGGDNGGSGGESCGGGGGCDAAAAGQRRGEERVHETRFHSDSSSRGETEAALWPRAGEDTSWQEGRRGKRMCGVGNIKVTKETGNG